MSLCIASSTLFPYTTLFRSRFCSSRSDQDPYQEHVPGSHLPVGSLHTCFSRRSQSRCVTGRMRSEEHTSELQSRGHLVCRLLLEKIKSNIRNRYYVIHINCF